MREAIGNVFIINFVIVFVGIFIFFFAGSLAYTKAFKVKNKIINIIEERGGYDSTSDDLKIEITDYLKDAGYRIVSTDSCPERDGMTLVNGSNGNNNIINGYLYCVWKSNNESEVETDDKSGRGTYYGVQTYMYFDIPIIGQTITIPVYGETKYLGMFD